MTAAVIDGARTRVVAGSAFGVTGPVSGIDVEPLFLDVTVSRGVRFSASSSFAAIRKSCLEAPAGHGTAVQAFPQP